MNGLTITDVRVRLYERGDDKLKAFATVTFNRCFVVCDLKVIQGPKGVFVAMPSRKGKDGAFRDIAHPLNQECRDAIETRVLAAYGELSTRPGGNGSGIVESPATADSPEVTPAPDSV